MEESLNTSLAEKSKIKSCDKSGEENIRFDEVLFMNVKCIYNPSYDIALKYVILDAVKVSTLDWIGIFRITSIKPSDFITFQYSKQENNSNSTLQIIFPNVSLLEDDQEFYVFAYVTESNAVKGVSTPFQIKRKSELSKFIEFEDDVDNGFCFVELKSDCHKQQADKLEETNKRLLLENNQLLEDHKKLKVKLTEKEKELIKLKSLLSNSQQKYKVELAEKNKKTENLLQKAIQINGELNKEMKELQHKYELLQKKELELKAKCEYLQLSLAEFKNNEKNLKKELCDMKEKQQKVEEQLRTQKKTEHTFKKETQCRDCIKKNDENQLSLEKLKLCRTEYISLRADYNKLLNQLKQSSHHLQTKENVIEKQPIGDPPDLNLL